VAVCVGVEGLPVVRLKSYSELVSSWHIDYRVLCLLSP
jgi:hypothetical protein